jgi:hypothetical protein
MSIQVTQGAGTSIATVLKAAAHHQRVITHGTRIRVVVTPVCSALSYTAGQYMGGEIQVPNFFRGAPEPGLTDSTLLEVLEAGLTGLSSIDFSVVFLAAELQTPPVDGQSPALGTSPAESVDKVQQIVPINSWASSFGGLYVGGNAFGGAAIFPPCPLFAAPGETSLRIALVAQGSFTLPSPTSLVLAISGRQD